MGERKGQNFYYPPDFDYKKHKSLNSYHGTHALRERAAKIKQGILIIRFEMPFNIWCLGCNNHIGMGVRYNAEKKKVGMYYSTPIYEFRMRCHLCEMYFVIRTDPENFDYELVEGCRRQEKRYDPSTIDQLGAVDRGFSFKLDADKMFKVEHDEKDRSQAESSSCQIETLERIQYRMKDDFGANQMLRRRLRMTKEALAEKRAIDDNLRARTSLDIDLLPESAEDQRAASAIIKSRKPASSLRTNKDKRSPISDRYGNVFDSTTKPNMNTITRRDIGVILKDSRKGEVIIDDSSNSTDNLKNGCYNSDLERSNSTTSGKCINKSNVSLVTDYGSSSSEE